MTIVGKPFINSRQEMECIDIADINENFDNILHAIKVYRTGGGLSQGMWRQITGTNTIDIDLPVGF